MQVMLTLAFGLLVAASAMPSQARASGDSAQPQRIMNGRVYNDSSAPLQAWASGTGFITVAAHSRTGDLDVDHVQVCEQWYKIRYDGWVRVYDGCRLSWLGTQCKTDGPGQPCS